MPRPFSPQILTGKNRQLYIVGTGYTIKYIIPLKCWQRTGSRVLERDVTLPASLVKLASQVT